MNTQEEYHDLYLRTDVRALADCMLAHRKEWRSLYDLDALQAMTLPSAALQAMLKVSKARVELITDSNGGMEFMDLVNKNIRGGVSCIFQPFARANNPKCLHLPPDPFADARGWVTTSELSSGDVVSFRDAPTSLRVWKRSTATSHCPQTPTQTNVKTTFSYRS